MRKLMGIKTFKTAKRWVAGLALGACLASPLQAQLQMQLQLPDLAREAALNNPDLAAAREQVNKAKAESKAAYTDFFPRLSANMGYNAANSAIVGDGVVDSPNNRGTQQQLSIGPQLNQNIFSGFRTTGLYQKSREDLRAAEANYALVKSQVSYALKTAFARVVYNQRLIKLNRSIVERRLQNMRLVELRFQGGRENKGSFLRSEAQHKQAVFDVDRAEQDRRVALAELAKAIGQNELAPLEVKGDFKYKPPEKTPDFEALAVGTPSYAQASAQAGAAKSSVKVAKSEAFPSVDGVASFSRIRNDWQTDINRWTAGVNLSYPFLNGGRTYYEIKSARAEQRRSDQALKSTNQDVLFNLKKAYADFSNSIEAIDVQKKLLEAAETRAEIARSQYANGLMSYQDWDIIENELINTQKTLLASLQAAVVAEAAWEQAQGKGILP